MMADVGSSKAMYQWLRMGNEGGKPLCIQRPNGTDTANEAEIDRMTRAAWSPIYNRWQEGQEPNWTAFLRNFPPAPPPSDTAAAPLDQGDLVRALRRLNNRTAGGADGWRVQELKKMPRGFLTPPAHIHSCIEQGGPWPKAAQQILVTLLSKKGKPSPPQNEAYLCHPPPLQAVGGGALEKSCATAGEVGR